MSDASAFLFTLVNPHSLPPTQYHINHGASSAIATIPLWGVYFGSGPDLIIASDSNQNGSSYTNFPSAYIDTTGKGIETFVGTKFFTTTEIEVYSVTE
jgi:hypothetical protein